MPLSAKYLMVVVMLVIRGITGDEMTECYGK